MNTTKLLPAFLAAGLAGMAVAELALSPAVASLPLAGLFYGAAGAGLGLIALLDISRRIEPLRPKAAVIRPNLPEVPTPWRAAAAPATPDRKRTAA